VPRFQFYAQKYGYQKGQCPGAEAIADESLALPVGPHLDESAMAAIVQGMQEALKKIS
jgi:dTDP-4-amino-4,6-dideoxygalactose transaminase